MVEMNRAGERQTGGFRRTGARDMGEGTAGTPADLRLVKTFSPDRVERRKDWLWPAAKESSGWRFRRLYACLSVIRAVSALLKAWSVGVDGVTVADQGCSRIGVVLEEPLGWECKCQVLGDLHQCRRLRSKPLIAVQEGRRGEGMDRYRGHVQCVALYGPEARGSRSSSAPLSRRQACRRRIG